MRKRNLFQTKSFQFFKKSVAFSSLSKWPRNLNCIAKDRVPIFYGFRPWIRVRLSLRGLALRRNPWTFGLDVSDIDLCYSCQHSHFWYLQYRSRDILIDLQNVPLPSKLPMAEGFVPSVNSLSPLHFRCEKAFIIFLDLWAITLSLKDGWF